MTKRPRRISVPVDPEIAAAIEVMRSWRGDAKRRDIPEARLIRALILEGMSEVPCEDLASSEVEVEVRIEIIYHSSGPSSPPV